MTQQLGLRWVKLLAIALLTIGIYCRFGHLDRKVYSADEVLTLLRVSGYGTTEFVETAFDGSIVTAGDFRAQYQQVNSSRNFGDVFRAFTGNPEHPPLYYLLARWAMQHFNQPVAARWVAALVSLLIFPVIYWLFRELFDSEMVAWMAISAVAISPFQLVYAQEARQYSLWMATILGSSLALLRALRLQTRRAWAWYAIISMVGLYSHIFHLFVLASQGLYVLLAPTEMRAQGLRGYGAAAAVSLVVFSPWVVIIVTRVETVSEKTAWIRSGLVSFQAISQSWWRTIGRLFVDINSVALPKVVAIALYYGLPILTLYALYFLWRKTPARTSLLLFATIIVPIIPLYLIDLASGSRASATPRYSIPAYLAVQIAVIFLLAWKATEMRSAIWQRRCRFLWQLTFAGLLVIGCFSSVALTKSVAPWTKGLRAVNWPIGKIVNQSEASLTVDCQHSSKYQYLLSLSHQIKPSGAIMMAPDNALCYAVIPMLPKLQQQYERIFLYFPTVETVRDLETLEGLDLVTLKSSHRGEVWLAEIKSQSSPKVSAELRLPGD